MRKDKLTSGELKAYVIGLLKMVMFHEEGKTETPEFEALQDSLDFGEDLSQEQRDLIGVFFGRWQDREPELCRKFRAELETLSDDMIEHFLRG